MWDYINWGDVVIDIGVGVGIGIIVLNPELWPALPWVGGRLVLQPAL
jgi:hypothetical protein